MNKTKSLCKQCAYLIRSFTFVNEYIFFYYYLFILLHILQLQTLNKSSHFVMVVCILLKFFVIYLQIEVDFEKNNICYDIIVYMYNL